MIILKNKKNRCSDQEAAVAPLKHNNNKDRYTGKRQRVNFLGLLLLEFLFSIPQTDKNKTITTISTMTTRMGKGKNEM